MKFQNMSKNFVSREKFSDDVYIYHIIPVDLVAWKVIENPLWQFYHDIKKMWKRVIFKEAISILQFSDKNDKKNCYIFFFLKLYKGAHQIDCRGLKELYLATIAHDSFKARRLEFPWRAII